MIEAKITLPNFQKQFNSNINKELKKIIKTKIPKILERTKSRLEQELVQSIASSNTWIELQNSILRGELGIQSTSGLDNILNTWARGIQVTYESNNSLGVIKIGMIRSDYSDVLSLPEASFAYSSSRGSGIIEWLRWLLLESNSIIVAGYEFKASNAGRTGLGIMVKSRGGWQIPTQHAGTATDNFATRSLSDIKKTIDQVMDAEIKRGF